MPSARYWRIIGIDTYAGGNLELSELALYGNGVRADGPTTVITSTATPSSGTLTALSDNDTLTSVTFAGSDVALPSFEIVWDFGSSVVIDLAEPKVIAYDTAPIRFVVQCLVAGAWTSAFVQNYSYSGNPLVIDTSSADPYFNNVVYLLSSDTRIEDASKYGRQVTNAGVTLLPQFFLYGANSFYVGFTTGGVNPTFMAVDYSDTLNGDFTVEVVVAPGSYASTRLYPVSFSGGTANSLSLVFSGGAWAVVIADSSGTTIAVSTARIVTATPRHVAWTRLAGQNQLWINGAADVTWTDSSAISAVTIKSFLEPQDNLMWFTVDAMRITKGIARYTSNFSVPSTVFPSYTWYGKNYKFKNTSSAIFTPISQFAPSSQTSTKLIAEPAPLSGSLVGNTSVNSGVTPPSVNSGTVGNTGTYYYANPLLLELLYGGGKSITGNVKKEALPSNLPLSRRVRLYSGSRLIRETWSDAVTGDFTFTDIAADAGPYKAIAYDYENNYRALISENLEAT